MIDPIPVYTPQTIPAKKNNGVIVVVVIVVLLIIAVFFIFRNSKKTTVEKTGVAATGAPMPTQTPAPVDKKTVTIQVQNGTGTPGQAGSAVKALTDAGYLAANIKTGNAPDYTNTVTTISAKTGFDANAQEIKTALGGLFDNITINPTSLDSTGSYDIVVVTGGKIYASPTPAVNPSQTPIPVETTTVTPTPTTTNTPTPTPTP